MMISACLVTRGDIDMHPIVDSLPNEWEVVIWNNGAGLCTVLPPGRPKSGYSEWEIEDCAVYGRYAAIAHASGDLIYVQDDDVLVSEPATIATIGLGIRMNAEEPMMDVIVCNMPQEFRHSFYEEHALSGFGAVFPRSLPDRTFQWFREHCTAELPEGMFNRTCDIVMTGLTQRVLVDYPIEHMPYASDENRMWKQPSHQGERNQMLGYVKAVSLA